MFDNIFFFKFIGRLNIFYKEKEKDLFSESAIFHISIFIIALK